VTRTAPSRLDLSVVIPVLNEEANVEELLERLRGVLDGHTESLEIIFVDDGSTDRTFATLQRLAREQSCVRVIRFARNYGQEAAVQAGMLRSSGRWVLQTDGDLQNPPEEIPKLLALRDRYEIIYGARKERRDPIHRVVASRLMVLLMRHVLGIQLPKDVTTFRLIDGDVARFIASLPEKRKFFSALTEWSGARSVSVPVAHEARRAGTTKYTLAKLVNHTFDLMVGFSVRPLRIIGMTGAAFAIAGMLFALYRVAQKLWGIDITMGYTSLFAAIVIIGGLQLVALSVIGEYVGRIFIQTQDRPLYRIAEELGFASAASPSLPAPNALQTGCTSPEADGASTSSPSTNTSS
jgi:glycosyltransferase involved in cell wall biosynthesis